VGMAGIEADAWRLRLDLLQQAQQQGIKLSREQVQEIDNLVAAYRKMAEELAVAEAMADINFDLSIMGLSEGDQRIMTALRRLGIEADSAYGQMVGGALRYRDVQ